MFTIDLRSSTPIFEQIYQNIGKFIALEVLKPDEKLPTVRTLARDLGINPNTVSKAYQEAERAGLIYSVAGVGMFVSNTRDGVNVVLEDAYNALQNSFSNLLDLGEPKEKIISWLKEKNYD